MNTPKPPFSSISEELLYNIYLKVSTGNGNGITPNDIDTLAKLNSILKDAVLMKADDIMSAINALKGDVPAVANSLEKLYNIVQGLTYLKREDIDTLAELNALVTDGNLVRVEELAEALVSLNLKYRSFQFFFSGHWDDHENYNHDRDMLVIRGKISSLSQVLTDSLSDVTYKSRLDIANTWTFHPTLPALQTWINSFVSGSEEAGTLYWIKCLPQFKYGRNGDAVNVFKYSVS